MAAPKGNKNARKKGPKRLDVHISLADTPQADRRSKMERYMQSLGEEYTEQDIIHVCQQWLYDWIDGLSV